MRKKINIAFFILFIIIAFYIVIIFCNKIKTSNQSEKIEKEIDISMQVGSIEKNNINETALDDEIPTKTEEEIAITTECILTDISSEANKDDILFKPEITEVSQNDLIISEEDFNAICSVVEAETHGGDTESKIHIVSVIINRVNSSQFPDTIQGVCYQSNQFASRSDVEQSTIDAVNIGLNNGDTVQGALFFCTCKGCWADCNKEYLFTDDIGHSFYK